jgi:hypothetical protein
VTDLHNGQMRATLRLVSVWTSVTLVAVGGAWCGLRAAVDTAMDDAPELSAFDPSALTRKPSSNQPFRSRDNDGPATAPAPPKANKPASPVTNPSTTSPTPRPTPSKTNRTPSTTPPPTPLATPTAPLSPPDEVTRLVRIDGGTVTFHCTDGWIRVVSYTAEAGYAAQGYRDSDDSIVFKLVSGLHLSVAHASPDKANCLRVSVREEDL